MFSDLLKTSEEQLSTNDFTNICRCLDEIQKLEENSIPTSVKVVSFDTRSLWRYFDFQSFWYFVHRNVATQIVYMMVFISKI
jgi:hypothetical protein